MSRHIWMSCIKNGFVQDGLKYFSIVFSNKWDNIYYWMDHHTSSLIFYRYLSTWFIFDVCSTAPLQSISFLFTNETGEVGFKLLNMLRLWRLRRVSSLFARYYTIISFFCLLLFIIPMERAHWVRSCSDTVLTRLVIGICFIGWKRT